MSEMEFADHFNVVVRPQGRRAQWHPWRFVEAWIEFVEEVEDGYSGDLYEYENELSVRDDLERAASDSDLVTRPEWRVLVAQVGAADARLRGVLTGGPEVRPGREWWRERLPVSSGEEFADDAARLFGVEVEDA